MRVIPPPIEDGGFMHKNVLSAVEHAVTGLKNHLYN